MRMVIGKMPSERQLQVSRARLCPGAGPVGWYRMRKGLQHGPRGEKQVLDLTKSEVGSNLRGTVSAFAELFVADPTQTRPQPSSYSDRLSGAYPSSARPQQNVSSTFVGRQTSLPGSLA